jgi:hypothetical protein
VNRRHFFGALAGLAIAPAANAIPTETPVVESVSRFAEFMSPGMYVFNASPLEQGPIGLRYIVSGWVINQEGEWEEVRCLTGN